MPKFNGLVLTDAGNDLMMKTIADGMSMSIVRIAVGDGELPPNTPFYGVTELAYEVQSVTNIRKSIVDERVLQLEFTIRTSEIGEGFWFREIGIFAMHPELGEILYAYENVGSLADYMPAFGGATVINRTIRVLVYVGNASTVVIQSAGAGNTQVFSEQQTVSDGQTDFTLTKIDAETVISVNIDGIEYFDFEGEDDTVRLLTAPPAGSVVWFRAIRAEGTANVRFTVQGRYPTLAALESMRPTGRVGDAYFIGKGSNATVYVWDVDTEAWVDVGPVQGPMGEKGETGERGEKGDKGDIGQTGAKGDKGDTGPMGEKGDTGDPGEPGRGFTLLGRYESFAALEAAHPIGIAGEAYAADVGGMPMLYVWVDDKWLDMGPLGTKGEEGKQGEKGDTGAQGPAGAQGVVNFSSGTADLQAGVSPLSTDALYFVYE